MLQALVPHHLERGAAVLDTIAHDLVYKRVELLLVPARLLGVSDKQTDLWSQLVGEFGVRGLPWAAPWVASWALRLAVRLWLGGREEEPE
jgi:hypothetical protein